jgi:putative hydrolase of HD superfamily
MKKRDIDLLFEVGALRRVPRMWIHFLGPDMANNAEHSYRVAWIALLIAKEEGVTDTGKILQMALVHDLTEGRTGDANYLMRQYVKRDDELAGKDIFADTGLEGEMLAALEEYRGQTTLAAQIVKDADRLDVEFEIREVRSRGMQLPKEWEDFQRKVADEKLSTDTARSIMRSLPDSDPHAWHTKSRNRFVGGDYSERSGTG